MNRSRNGNSVVMVVALLALCGCLVVSASAQAWFGGGSYDGYDKLLKLSGMGLPQVNNAVGATNILPDSAFLTGMLMYTGDAPAEVSVYWGLSDGETNATEWGHSTNFGFVGERVLLSTNVMTQSGSQYYYRFYAVNSAGQSGWAESSVLFEVPGPPEVTAGPGALPLSRTTATLNGELTNGISAEITISWGTDPQNWDHIEDLGSVTVGKFRLILFDLTPATEYYYTIEAANDHGTDTTADIAFTTLSDSAWYAGGSYDGYSMESGETEVRSDRGTMILIY